jgi:hypothetical protein
VGVAFSVAIGHGQRGKPLPRKRRDDLSDRAAGVVGHQIEPIQPQMPGLGETFCFSAEFTDLRDIDSSEFHVPISADYILCQLGSRDVATQPITAPDNTGFLSRRQSSKHLSPRLGALVAEAAAKISAGLAIRP